MTFFYNIGIQLFDFGINLVSRFSVKAQLLKMGRNKVWREIFDNSERLRGGIWIHCASLGEFEQGRPIIEAIKKRFPKKRIVLTFFSPSGYEVRKDYSLVDFVCYLPSDTKRNAQRFVDLFQPEMAVFIKYEFWFHYLSELRRNDISTFIVSAIFRTDQFFFKWYGGWFRKMLECFSWIFVQDVESLDLLKGIGVDRVSVGGDSRFDRVVQIAASANDIPAVRNFSEGSKVLVAGSTWPEDERIVLDYINRAPVDYKLIIAPHEIGWNHLKEIERQITVPYAFFTDDRAVDWRGARVLIMDTIGLLSSVYRYGQISYIGGGFGKGIHNTLEAATYGMPVVFGPRFKKFKEAKDLILRGGGFSIGSACEFESVVNGLWNDSRNMESAGGAASDYVVEMQGATNAFLEKAFND